MALFKKTKPTLSESLALQLGENDDLGTKLRRMARQNKLAVASAVVLALLVLSAVFAPILTPYDAVTGDISQRLDAPSAAHWLGTDEMGRDVLTRLLYGARISLAVGAVPSLFSMLIGVALGMTAGFVGGRTDYILMRLADVMLAFPSLLLAMVIMYTLGNSVIDIFLALTLVSWASVARVARAETVSLKECEYVEAARSIGVKPIIIILRHILPNCFPSLIVLFTLNIPSAILSESSLSFLGIGIQLPNASWGLMVNMGRQFLYNAPWISLAPSGAIMLVVLACNFLGDGLRDALDPHLNNT